MRPQEAHRIVKKEFRKFYKTSVTDLPDLSILQCFKEKRVYQALKQLEEYYIKEEKRIFAEWGVEYFPSKAYYEDVVTVKDILEKFYYISDRWNCAGRIKFILRVIDNLE